MVKNPPVNAGDIRDAGAIHGLGRSPEGEHSNPLQYSCLENAMDRGTWQATVHEVTRVGHNLATKPPPPSKMGNKMYFILNLYRWILQSTIN